MSESTRWALPLLAVAQAQKEVTHNEAVLAIDRLLHLAVNSRSISDPPTDAHIGDAYIVGDDPSGPWTGWSHMLATFDGVGWIMTPPRKGCLAWIAAESQFTVYDGAQWSAGNVGALAIEPPQGGAVIDSQCRTALTALLVALGSQGIILPNI